MTSPTTEGMIRALSLGLLPQTRPENLRDVLRMKRAAGHNDADDFKRFACAEFAVKLNATIGGAINAERQWIKKLASRDGVGLTERRMAFLAELEAVQRGEWDHLFRQIAEVREYA